MRLLKNKVSKFPTTRLNVLQYVRDLMSDIQDRQREQADAKGKSCMEIYKVEEQVLLNVKKLLTDEAASALYRIFSVLAKRVLAYTLNLPRKLRTHPLLYAGMIKSYRNSN